MRTPDPWAIPTTPFTLGQVAPRGVTRHHLAGALARGAITRLRQGVYVSTSTLPSDPRGMHELRALAEQVAAPTRIGSGRTAAIALGLPLLRSDLAAAGPVHLTQPQDGAHARGRRRPGMEFDLGELPTHHLMTLPSGLVVTTPARTALDLAAEMELPEALMVVDAALRLELGNLVGRVDRRAYRNTRAVTAAMGALQEAAMGVKGRARRAHVQAVLAIASPLRESPLESWSCGHFHLAGLPEPTLQKRLRTPLGDMYPDCTWEEFMVIGEADGEGKYTDQSAFAREKERESAFRDLGWSVFRWTGREGFGTPDAVVGRARRALAAGGWIG